MIWFGGSFKRKIQLELRLNNSLMKTKHGVKLDLQPKV